MLIYPVFIFFNMEMETISAVAAAVCLSERSNLNQDYCALTWQVELWARHTCAQMLLHIHTEHVLTQWTTCEVISLLRQDEVRTVLSYWAGNKRLKLSFSQQEHYWTKELFSQSVMWASLMQWVWQSGSHGAFSSSSFGIHSTSVCDCNLMMNWEVLLLGHTGRELLEVKNNYFLMYGCMKWSVKSPHPREGIPQMWLRDEKSSQISKKRVL